MPACLHKLMEIRAILNGHNTGSIYFKELWWNNLVFNCGSGRDIGCRRNFEARLWGESAGCWQKEYILQKYQKRFLDKLSKLKVYEQKIKIKKYSIPVRQFPNLWVARRFLVGCEGVTQRFSYILDLSCHICCASQTGSLLQIAAYFNMRKDVYFSFSNCKVRRVFKMNYMTTRLMWKERLKDVDLNRLKSRHFHLVRRKC